ncbi:MAG: PEGA domain-containing protein [Vulcanimicrobiota bacterium]
MEKHFVKGYWLKEEVGSSDHSIIYSASFSVTGKDVALKKLLTPSLLLAVQKEDAINNFLAEVSKRSTFTHPNVLELYDCFEHENDIYFIIESAIGKSLKEYAKSGRYYTFIDKAMFFFEKAADGLRESSAHDYLHRNMKPENFLITCDNELKITDYMICSRLFREQQVRSDLDADRYENVSYYSAPETIEKKELTARSNIFSLGVVMYECLTGGTHPFRSHSDEETYEAIVGKEPVQAKILNPSLPEVVNYILDRALKKDPFERYADFREMLEDFDYYFNQPHENKRLNLYRTRGFANAILKVGDFSQKYFRLASRKAESLSSETSKRLKKNPIESLFVEAELDPSKIKKKKAIKTSDESDIEAEMLDKAPVSLLPQETDETDKAPLDLLPQETEETDKAPLDLLPQETEETDKAPLDLLPQEADETDKAPLELLPQETEETDKAQIELLPQETAEAADGTAADTETSAESVSPAPLRPMPGEPFFYRRLPFIMENQKAIMVFGIAGILLFFAILAGAYVYGRMTAAKPLPPLPTKIVANTGTSSLLVTCNISDGNIELKRTDEKYPPLAGRLDFHGNWEVSGIASGAYEINITKEGYYPFFNTAMLKDNDRTIVNAEMGTRIPAIDITTTPSDARISLDGSYIGVSPLKTYGTRPGDYELSITLEGYGSYKEKITLFKGEVFLRKITLEKAKKEVGTGTVKQPHAKPSPSPKPTPSKAAPPPATVYFDSRPSVASVFLNGKEVGITPFEYTIPGDQKTAEVSITKKGYRDWNDTLALESGKRQEVFADMESTEPVTTVPKTTRISRTPQTSQASSPMNLAVSSNFSRAALYDKMRGEEVLIDFQRDKLEQRLQNFAQDQILEGRNKKRGGNYRLNVYFAIQVDTRTRSTNITTRLIGTFHLVDETNGRTLLEESDSQEFSCDAGSVESIPADPNNYSRVRIVSTSAATEAALSMINRKLSIIESAVQSGH